MSDFDEDDNDWPDASDHTDDSGDSTDTEPCPKCNAMIYGDAEQCPRCGAYVSASSSLLSRPARWVVIVAIVCIVMIGLLWIIRGGGS